MAEPYNKPPCDEQYNSSPPKPWTPIEIIPAEQAVYCADCDAYTRARNGHCLGCGSSAIVNAAKMTRGEICFTPVDWWFYTAQKGTQ